MTTLAGKVALVTGGGRGIGRGIVLALAEAGADVAIADVDTLAAGAQQYGDSHVSGFACAQRTAAEVGERGRRAVAIAADVTSKVACAAMDEATWDLTFAVNVKGVFLSCQAAIPTLVERGGCIIAVASVAGKNGAPGLAHYCASKFAVVGFTNALAKELAPANVRVNAICPGILRTQMWEYLAETLRTAGETRDQSWERYIKQLIPLGRPQTPEDIGRAAVYLATAPNVTGQALNVDGGMELH